MRGVWIAIMTVLAAGVILQMIGASHGVHHSWEKIPGFWGLFGFFGGGLLIILSALMRRLGVKRKEDRHGVE